MGHFYFIIHMLAEYDGTAWAWHLNDGLGSVRQLVGEDGDVTLAQGYTPFGVPLWSERNGSTGYGFTGERWEAYAELLFLRARYYEPGVGRFISKDSWKGNIKQPLTMNPYLYVLDDPVNAVDPTGRYHREVHYDLTRRLASELASSQGVPGQASAQAFAIWISTGDWHVDSLMSPLHSGFCGECHFCDWNPTVSHVERALTSCNAYLFGATLHQLQDWFSHWNEGYPRSHFGDTMRAGAKSGGRSSNLLNDFFEGGHYEWLYEYDPNENQPYEIWGESPYPAHPRSETIAEIKRRNPGLGTSGLSDDTLIDLYLRREPATDPNWAQKVEERSHFGLDPDKYVPGSLRDILMEVHSRIYIARFLQHSLAHCCEVEQWADDVTILAYLKGWQIVE